MSNFGKFPTTAEPIDYNGRYEHRVRNAAYVKEAAEVDHWDKRLQAGLEAIDGVIATNYVYGGSISLRHAKAERLRKELTEHIAKRSVALTAMTELLIARFVHGGV